MTASGQGEWDALEALWQRAPLGGDAPAAMRERVDARRRRLLRGAAWDYLLLVGAIVLFVVLVRHTTPVERLTWAFGLLAFAAYAIADWASLRREQWRVAAEGTATYLEQTLACLHQRLRLVIRAWQLFGAMILLDVALWLWRYLSDPANLEALRERAVLTVFALSVFTAALAAWSWIYAWRGGAERAALEALRRNIDPAT